MYEAHELSRDECMQLLGAGVAGRIALVTPTGPHIMPVNYSVQNHSTLIRTTAYSLIGTYGRDTVVAFEVDKFDHEYQRGWSVVARGRAEIVDDARELAQIQNSWPPRPWATGQRNLVVRIPWTELSGRRLGLGWNPYDELSVRRSV
ncbi:MAG: pyridoxamine 5'-phosphate oxidase family protein [Nocardioides sp.]|uniref:pyridoxamine 5'-phosphate oxidase family protein n=1 Tax=Nocardioides sp. TaxID=35761 RepID=UPI003F04D61B